MFGVGSGPILTSAGVGGPRSGVGSRNRGKMVDGVGVLSIDVDSMGARSKMLLVGVGVVGVDVAGNPKPLHDGSLIAESSLPSIMGVLSNVGVNSGTIRFQTEFSDPAPVHVAEGVYLSTRSCHCSNKGFGRWRFQSILLRKLRSFWLISQILRPDILPHALAE